MFSIENPSGEILHLAKSGNLSKVKKLLLNHPDPNFKNEVGGELLFTVVKEWHLFHHNVKGGTLALIDFLVDEIGIDVNKIRDKYGNSLLSTAISKVECRITTWRKGQEHIIHLRLVDYQSLQRSTIKECDDGGLEVILELNAGVVAHLLSKGAQPDITKKLSCSAIEEVMSTSSSIELSSPACITEALLLETENKNTPICYTVSRGLPCTTRLLLEAGANINTTDGFGNTLLQLVALEYGSIVPNTYKDVAKLLIEYGIDLNQKGSREEYPVIALLEIISAEFPDELDSMLEELRRQKHTMNSELKLKIEDKFGSDLT
ncbi:MAG: hypothetical protein LBJ80_00530 [Rickettsiales bacterium]|nr:hypothetical protein [Rickettsiales bacterium]MDR1260898.1 hypothetical protein [Rickettsiales bacterium]